MPINLKPETKTVSLIGSSKFKTEFQRVGMELEKKGILVLVMSFFQHADMLPVSLDERVILEEVDRRRIDMAEEIVVINCKVPWCSKCQEHRVKVAGCSKECGWEGFMKPYIGEDTKKEIAYAHATLKPVHYINYPDMVTQY